MTAAGAGGTPKKNWAARDTTKGVNVPLGANGIALAIMGDVENADVTVNIYIYAEKGPAEFVASGTYTIGSQEVVADPTLPDAPTSTMLYADTFVYTDQGWPNSKIGLIDYEADEGITEVVFDAMGAYFLKVEISAIDGGLTVIPMFKHW
jgi:hypothetical protein